MKKITVNLITLFIVLPFLNLYPQTDVYLKVYTKTFQRMEIDLYPFIRERTNADSEVFASLVSEVLSNDLWMSGFFKVKKRFDMPPTAPQPNNPGSALAWVDGRFEITNLDVSIKPNLVDRASGRTIIRATYPATPGQERLTIHKIADDMVYSLTGERGIARSKIAFVREVARERKEIAIMDYDGQNSAVVTADKSINLSPAWSPDGSRVCYTSFRDNNPNLYVINLQTNTQMQLSALQGLNSAPAWSRDGEQIALTLSKDGNAEIYLFNVDNKKLKRLTYNNAIDSSPTWSPSNRELAFTSDRSGLPQVYIMDTDGLNARRLTYEGSYNDSPAWSPRGDKIAYVSRTASGFDIYTIDVTGENNMRLTDSSGSNEDPFWSPNGFALVFSSNRNGQKEIYSMFWDGTDQKKLTTGGGNYSPAWSPGITF